MLRRLLLQLLHLEKLPRRMPVVVDDVTAVRFPPSFLWGAATADHQVEHSQPDDWTAFEEDARRGGRQRRVSMGTGVPGHIHGVVDVPLDVLRKKADFDTRFAEDLALAAELGHNAHRFSISWARLFPREDMTEPDPAGIDFYGRVLAEHRRAGLKPFVTLFHFASPQWLWRTSGGKRGLERHDAIDHFARFATAVARCFGDDVRHWCTLNEPMVLLTNGYRDGMFPPNERRADPRALLPVMRALLGMHAAGWDALKSDARKRGIENEVGQTAHTRLVVPYTNGLLDRATAHLAGSAFLWWFTDCIERGALFIPGYMDDVIPGLRGSQDYVGINYYGRMYVKARVPRLYDPEILLHDPQSSDERSPMGWAADAAGFQTILAEAARRYAKPIYVLENGVVDSDDDDVMRQRFLERHVRSVGRALQERADVRGYFHWSLLDNFEWAEGFEPRFGLVAVDYENGFRRTPRKSAYRYAKIIRDGGL